MTLDRFYQSLFFIQKLSTILLKKKSSLLDSILLQ